MSAGQKRITVIGGGVLGTAAAARIAARGHRVTLVTAEGEGPTLVSRASLAWVNTRRRTPAAYAAFAADARAAHARSGVDTGWFVQTGSSVGDTETPEDGYVDAERFGAAHLAHLHAHGGGLVHSTRVDALRRTDAGIRLDTDAADEGVAPADAVVIAAGTGTARLVRSIGAEPGRLGTATGPAGYLARIRLDDAPARISSADGLQLRPDGAGVLAAQSLRIEAELRERGEPLSADSVWPALRAEVESALGRSIPADALIRFDTAVRPESVDGLPVAGWVTDGVYALLAHSGMTLATLLGELVARDLDGDADARLAPFRPDATEGDTP